MASSTITSTSWSLITTREAISISNQSFDPVAHLKDKTKRLTEEAFEKMPTFFTIKRIEGAKAIIPVDSTLVALNNIKDELKSIKSSYFNIYLNEKFTKNIKTVRAVIDYASKCFRMSSWFNETIKCELNEKYTYLPLEDLTIKYRYYLEHVDPYFTLFQQVIHHLMQIAKRCGLFDIEKQAIACDCGEILYFYPNEDGFIPIPSNPVTPGLEVLAIAYGKQTHAAAEKRVGEQIFLFNQGVQEKRSGCLVHVSSNRLHWQQESDRPYATSITGIFGQHSLFQYHGTLVNPAALENTAESILNRTNRLNILDLVIQSVRSQIEQIFEKGVDDYFFIPLPSEEEERHIVSLLCLEELEETFKVSPNLQEESRSNEVFATHPLSPTLTQTHITEMKQTTLSTLEKIMAQKYDKEWEERARQREQKNAFKAKGKKHKKGNEVASVEGRQKEDLTEKKKAFIQEKLKALRLSGKQHYTSLIHLIKRMIQSTPDIHAYLLKRGSHTTVHIEGAYSTTLVRPHGEGKELKFSEEQSYTIITDILDSMAYALQNAWQKKT